jgi:hypothetical protein
MFTSSPAPTYTPGPEATPSRTPGSPLTSTPTRAFLLTPRASPPPATTAAPTDSPAAEPSPTPTPTPTSTVAPAVTDQPSEVATVPEPDAAADESLVGPERLRNWVLTGVFAVLLVGLAGVGLALGLYALYRWRRLRQD